MLTILIAGLLLIPLPVVVEAAADAQRQRRSEWTRAIRGGRRLVCSELAGRSWPRWKSPPR